MFAANIPQHLHNFSTEFPGAVHGQDIKFGCCRGMLWSTKDINMLEPSICALSIEPPECRRRRVRAALKALRRPHEIAAIAQKHGVSLSEIAAWRRELRVAALRWQRKFRRRS